MSRLALTFGSAGGLIGVIFGAFGAHALASVLSPNDLSTWQTAVLYQFIHSIALLAAGLWSLLTPAKSLHIAIGAFILGILIFSGSLYLLVATDTRWLGAITPIGGTAFIVGWIALFVTAWQTQTDKHS